MTPRVSVVIPTYRRNDLLANCLASLGKQSLPADAFEVIVADNAGEAATRALVEDLAGKGGMTLSYVDASHHRGPAAARNAGWRIARGAIIAFTDDDCLPDPQWLAAGLAAMATGADAASGRVVMPLPERPTDYERDAAGLTTAQFVTANCFCRRDALESVGGFDERFTAAWREDSDLQFSLLEQGLTIATATKAVVLHPVRPAPWGISLWQQPKSRFDVLLRRKHPQLYARRIAAYPLKYWGIALGLGVIGAGVAAGHAPAALVGAGVWAGLTASFCLRRLQGTSRDPWHVGEMIVTSLLIPPLSLYWRLRGEWQFRALSTQDPGREKPDAVAYLSANRAGRPVQSAL